MKKQWITIALVALCMLGKAQTKDTTKEKTQSECEMLERYYDKFQGITTLSTGHIEGVTFYKSSSFKGTIYTIELIAYSDNLAFQAKGVTILFPDGSKIHKPNEKVEISDAGGSRWKYTVTFMVNPTELQKMKSLMFNSYRIYIFDTDVKNEAYEMCQDWLKMLIKCK